MRTHGTNSSNNNNNNHHFEYLKLIFANHHIFVFLRSNVHLIGGWDCPKLMHKSKYTWILVHTYTCHQVKLTLPQKVETGCQHNKPHYSKGRNIITLFRSIIVLRGTNNIPWNILSIVLNMKIFHIILSVHITMLCIELASNCNEEGAKP